MNAEVNLSTLSMPGITERGKALRTLYRARKRIITEPGSFVLGCVDVSV
jgi:hypothetical protein